MDLTLPLKLKVEVLKARNLLAADTNGKSDPYCRVSLGQRVFSTTVQHNTLNPEWQQSIAFINDDLAPFATCQESPTSFKILLLGYLSLEIWDRDFGNPDDFIGRLVIPLSSLPLTHIDTSIEQWYSLHRNSNKPISGDIQLKMALESVEDGLVLSNAKLNEDFLTVSIPLGYQLPILIENDVLNFPGSSEIVEIGFSKVYVELGSVSVEAMLLLTNYRLIIMSTSDNNRNSNNIQLNSISSQTNLNTEFNMWLALNNIASVEHGSGSTVVRRHVSGGTENVDSATVTIQCYDSRYIQIVFVMSSENGVNLVKPNEQPMPMKILKKVQTSQRKALRKLRKLKRIKKQRKHNNIIKKHDYDDPRTRSGAFFIEGTDGGGTDVGRSLLDECNEIREMDPGIRSDSFDDDDYDLLDDYPEEEEEEEEEEGYNDIDGITTPTEQDVYKEHLSALELAYRGLTLPNPTKTLVSSFVLRLDDITANIADHPPAFIYTRSESICDHSIRWDINSILLKDMRRFMSDRWRECAINSQEYAVCSTYPSFVFIPTQMADPEIEEIAKFRSKGRIPSLVWMDKKTRSFLLRSAQPLTGTSGKHCKEDERLIEYAMSNGPVGGGMTIFDARSFAAVQGNKLMGKGTEDVNRYAGCKLVYLDIPNIHAVRESYDAVKSLAFSSTSSKWLSNLENTQWLSLMSLILKGASLIARYIGYQEGSALIHCSDGWDRTAQLTSLTQLMIDSYYRTIDGFMVLISKEWLAYGHKFNDRLGHPLHPNERSPIFIQFLDCVYQMLQQYSTAFEFTELLLLCIADHINTRWFGTFLCNCDSDRVNTNVFTNTLPLCVHIAAIKDSFINPQYYPTNEKLIPAWTIRRLKLWDTYYLAWDGTSSIIPVITQTDYDSNIVIDYENTDHSNTITQLVGGATGGVVLESDTVVWMANVKAQSCLLCQQKFSFTRRKHHCRNCGRIYCNECSKHRVSLTHLGYSEAVRVCDNCFRIHNNITTHKATNNLETHQEDGFQIFEVKTQSTTD